MVEAIVLAAGRGTRFGGVKPLARVGGATVLSRTVEALRGAGLTRIAVVVGHRADVVGAEARRLGCAVIENPAYATGMAGSLRAGIQAVSPGADGFLVVHADMPFLRAETVRAVLAAAADGASIARAVLDDRPGFPVYFRVPHAAPLVASVNGDRGARDYIAAHASELVPVRVEDRGSVDDVDTPEELVEGRRR